MAQGSEERQVRQRFAIMVLMACMASMEGCSGTPHGATTTFTPDQQLIAACYRLEVDEVRGLLHQDADVNGRFGANAKPPAPSVAALTFTKIKFPIINSYHSRPCWATNRR
jgi:hypothetical protein